MSLKLELANHSRGWYTGGDKLRGTVTLSLSKETTVNSIIVSVYGISYTSLEKKGTAGAIAGCTEIQKDYTIVLDEMYQAFPAGALNPATAYTLQSGCHKFEFEITLPLYAMPQGTIGSKARAAQILPPSCSDCGDQMVQYTVKARANRDTAWGSTLSSQVFFIFLPSDYAPDPKCSLTAVCAKGTIDKNWWNIVGSVAKTCNSHRWELRGKPTAVATTPYNLELWVTFLAEESIEIASVEVRLEAITFARAGNLKDTFHHYDAMVKLKPAFKVNSEKGKQKEFVGLDLSFKVPEKTPPDFVTSNIRRSYKLVANIKYGHQNAVSPKHSVELKLPIQILSGITTPDWVTGEVQAPDRTYPMDSYYYTHRDRGIAIV